MAGCRGDYQEDASFRGRIGPEAVAEARGEVGGSGGVQRGKFWSVGGSGQGEG